MKKIFIAMLFMLSVFKLYPGLFSSYDKKTPEEVIRDLAIEQISNPEDSYINYNLGVALYQTRKYEAAKNNFERAVSNAKNEKLKERSYFNLANSCYKNALSGLPINWESESTKIEQDKLGVAIDNTKQAVKNYETFLELNKENAPAKANLKKAKELLEKLMKKQQQKQDQKKDDKKDQDKQKDQQKQQNQQDQKDQKDSEDQQSKDKSKKDKQNQQNQQQKQDGQQDKSQDKSSGQEEKQDSGQEEKQGQEGQSGEPGQEQKQPQELNESQQQAAQQAFGQKDQKESAEEKSMRLMLENLQSDEEGLQKLIIQRQTKNQKPLQSGQKPW